MVNAKDSMTQVAAHLRVRTRIARNGRRAHGECIRILVADTGSGIPGPFCDIMFEPFVSTKGEKRHRTGPLDR